MDRDSFEKDFYLFQSQRIGQVDEDKVAHLKEEKYRVYDLVKELLPEDRIHFLIELDDANSAYLSTRENLMYELGMKDGACLAKKLWK